MTVAKIESQIRSVFDFELGVIAQVLEAEAAALLPSSKALKAALDDLIEGRR